jgi:hypothetical protein
MCIIYRHILSRDTHMRHIDERMATKVTAESSSTLDVKHGGRKDTGDISGPRGNPQASTWQVLVNLIQKAFFKAILPGFKGERGGAGRGSPRRSERRGVS